MAESPLIAVFVVGGTGGVIIIDVIPLEINRLTVLVSGGNANMRGESVPFCIITQSVL
jgi:hypothetical protein